jgi:hypothetical protein
VGNQERFDDLVRGLARSNVSRRRALQLMCAALVGGALASIPGTAFAKKPPSCPGGQPKCHGKCCLADELCCSGHCTTLGTSQNCNSCNDPCLPNETCCEATEVFNVCRDLNSGNIDNCGACNNTCSGDDAQCCGGVCRNTDTDPVNCGCCDCPCAHNQSCCGALCVDLNTDPNNCGGCGKVCSGGQTCQSGVCQCPSGQATCGGSTCLDLQTDSKNCGKCGNDCLGGSCRGGQCSCCDNINGDGRGCAPNEICCVGSYGGISCTCCPSTSTCTLQSDGSPICLFS